MGAMVSYKTMSPIQWLNGIAALNQGLISFRALRVYLGCVELVAIREAAARRANRLWIRQKRGRVCGHRLYQLDELVRLTRASLAGIRRDLNTLQQVGLLTFAPAAISITEIPLPVSQAALCQLPATRSQFRPIPVPRRFLRFLCRCQSPALLKTAIAHLLRGLSLERTTGTIKSRGTVKLSWIAAIMGISERATRYARAELIRVGWISRDEHSQQWKLNRDGAYFEINLDWREQRGNRMSQARATEERHPVERSPGSQPDRLLIENAPPEAEKGLKFAPLNKRLETPYGIKDQEPRWAEPAGVSLKQESVGAPSIFKVVQQDLESFTRIEMLYQQARRTGMIEHSEASILNFLGAAVRAKTSKHGDPVRIFMGIIRQKLWHHITQAQEERARQALIRFRAVNPMVFRDVKPDQPMPKSLSCQDVLKLVGIDLKRWVA